MAKAEYIFINGAIVPWDEGTVHVSSAAFKFGAGVFEGIRGYWNEDDSDMYLFRLAEHMRRLEFSQRFMRYDEIVRGDYVASKVMELIRANGLRETVHIMSTVYVAGAGGPTVCGPVDLSITVSPGTGPGLLQKGCSAQVSSWQRLSDVSMPPRVKCNANYQNGRIAALQAQADGYHTAILLNARGKVAEGPGMCFFMVRDGVAITPSRSNDILESITRDTLVELLPELCGIPVEERDIDRSELVAADEAFFCGTAWEVTPIVDIDRRPIGTGEVGPISRDLQAVFLGVARGTRPEHPEWRSPVYGELKAAAAE